MDELRGIYDSCLLEYERLAALGLSLDMSRGKPGADQLDLSAGLTSALAADDYRAEDGTDCRNYGVIDGILEMKRLFAELMDVRLDEVLAGGNASLSLMYESVIRLTGTYPGTNKKFLCPAPGYDRHFSITEHLGAEMIPIAMTPDGPDMAAVRGYISDPDVVGIWCVPLYSNPQGIVYSEAVIREMAALSPASPNFRIIWDNAYMLHTLEEQVPQILNILRECEKLGNYDMPVVFSSFSKISYPGAGVCAMAASPDNLAKMRSHLIIRSIGPDKLNQLRHVRYFKDAANVRRHMQGHAEILRPKFQAVLDALSGRLEGKGIGTWLSPKGGYFIAFETLPGCAARTIALCAKAGLIMTPAGAAFPYGRDPVDSNIRIAPTFPPMAQLKQAMELFCTAVELAALEKLLSTGE